MVPVVADLPSLSDAFTEELAPALERAFDKASCRIRAVIITNPHNPLGQRYPRSVLESCLDFCKKHDLHFISDEVYALTSFESLDVPDPVPFVSALALDVKGLGCDLSKVHTVWSPSKDFGESGFRMVCGILLHNLVCTVLTS